MKPNMADSLAAVVVVVVVDNRWSWWWRIPCGGGRRGGYHRYGCCRRDYYGCYRCCSYKGEAMGKEPHNRLIMWSHILELL
uniref:Uncharacterized protein n=1 Tax=Solanum lycopersicum TaxID=4081 RepID=A0A3Q7J4L8_SOLLC